MKYRHFFVALVAFVCLAGCQNMTAPLTDSQANDSVKLAMSYPISSFNLENPKEFYKSIEYYKRACTRALIKMGIFISTNNVNACLDRWDLLFKEKIKAQQQAKLKAQQEAKENEFKARIAAIRAGHASIQTIEEAVAIYHASNGDSLMAQPLLHPDGRYYVIGGEIDPDGGLQSNSFVIREAATGIADMRAMALRQMFGMEATGAPAYAYISFQDKSHVPNDVRVGSTVSIVGAYTGNREYTTRDGTKHIMPVFTSRFIQTITAVDILKSLQ